jgi:hypothetical protein
MQWSRKKQHTALRPQNSGQLWKLWILALAPCSRMFRVAVWFRMLTRRQTHVYRTLDMNHASYLARNCRLRFRLQVGKEKSCSACNNAGERCTHAKLTAKCRVGPMPWNAAAARNCWHLRSSTVQDLVQKSAPYPAQDEPSPLVHTILI